MSMHIYVSINIIYIYMCVYANMCKHNAHATPPAPITASRRVALGRIGRLADG